MKPVISSAIIGLSIIFTALVLSNGYKNRNQRNNTINVVGLGEEHFTSDLIVWSGSFEKRSFDLKEAYAALDADRERIRTYLKSKGVKESELAFMAVNIIKQYDDQYNPDTRTSKSVFLGYLLTQEVKIESGEVDKIEKVSREITELINMGVEFSSRAPEYYYTKMAELKVQMIAEATADAKKRADKIAEEAGGQVGHLKNADMGIFQIIAQNSSEEYSWGGSFNTSSKHKTATITMRLEYEVD